MSKSKGVSGASSISVSISLISSETLLLSVEFKSSFGVSGLGKKFSFVGVCKLTKESKSTLLCMPV